jgi:hypothetical protein
MPPIAMPMAIVSPCQAIVTGPVACSPPVLAISAISVAARLRSPVESIPAAPGFGLTVAAVIRSSPLTPKARSRQDALPSSRLSVSVTPSARTASQPPASASAPQA